MIRKIRAKKEIVVVSQNKIGVLSEVAKVLSQGGINILALSGQAPGGVALMNMVVDNHARAKTLLRRKGILFYENPVMLIEVDDKPGVLLKLTRALAAKKIDILNVYATASTCCGVCIVALSTANNQKAIAALRGK